MSIRTDARNDLSQAMQQTLHIDASVMQAAAAAGNPLMSPAQTPTAAAMGDHEQHLASANEFNTNSPDHPLKRSIAINIRASLSDLCLRKQKAVWAPPSAEATKAIFSQKKFVDLAGTTDMQGDLKSVVLHNLTMTSQKSTFPIALGVRITGVDDSTFSATGESYSTISLPMADTHTSKVLQEDDTALGESLPSTHVLERPLFANECHSHSSITTCLCAQPTSLRASVRLRFALTPLTLCRADTQTHKPRACKHSPRLHVGEHRGECAPPPFKHSMTTQNVHSMLTRVSCVTEGIHEVTARRFCLVAAGNTATPLLSQCSKHSTRRLTSPLLCNVCAVQITRSCPQSRKTPSACSAPLPTSHSPPVLVLIVVRRNHP